MLQGFNQNKVNLRTGGSVVVGHCDAGGREFDSGRTNTQGLKITE